MDKAQTVYSLLKDVFFILDAGDRSLLSQYDLTVPRFYTLKHIHDSPGISLSELSERMISDKGNTSRIIKGMEAEGLVIREQHASDGRALCLYLSAQGERVCLAAMAAHDAYNESRFAPIDGIMERLVANLQIVKERLKNGPTADGSGISS